MEKAVQLAKQTIAQVLFLKITIKLGYEAEGLDV